MSSRLARATFALALAIAAALVASCSNNSNNSTAPNPVPGPNFSFAFPAAGTVASPGTSNKRTFTAAEVGTWTYHCIPHQSSGMTGTIVVDAAAPKDSAYIKVGFNGTGQDFRFFPGLDSIRPGGYVRWANVSTMTTHTVTRP